MTNTVTASFSHDAAGRPTQAQYALADNLVIVGNDYYSNNKVAKVVRQILRDSTPGVDLNESIGLTYDANGELLRQASTYKQVSGANVTQPGPIVDRPSQFETVPGGRITEDLQYQYKYDPEGNLIERTSTFSSITYDDKDSTHVTLGSMFGLSTENGVYPTHDAKQQYGGSYGNGVSAQVKFGEDGILQPGEYDLWITWQQRNNLGTGKITLQVQDDFTRANPDSVFNTNVVGNATWGWGMVLNQATGMYERTGNPQQLATIPISYNVLPGYSHADDGLKWFHVGTVHLDSPGKIKMNIVDDQGAIAFDAFKLTEHIAKEVIEYDYANRPIHSSVYAELGSSTPRIETFYAYDVTGHMVAVRNVDRIKVPAVQLQNEVIQTESSTIGYAYQGAQQIFSFGLNEWQPDYYQKIKSFNLIGPGGEVLATDSTTPPPANSQRHTAWQFNNLDGTRFVDSQNWFPSDYAFAGDKLQSTTSDYLMQSRDASRHVWGGEMAGSAAWSGTKAFFGSLGSSAYRFGNGIAQLGANAVDTAMIGINAGTTLAGMDWQYQAIGSLGAAVESGGVTTGDIAWGVGTGLFTAATDTISLGGYAAYQYAHGQITAEEAGDRFLGLGLSALGGAGALRAAGMANLTVGQAAVAAGRTAVSKAQAVGAYAANASRAVVRMTQQIELRPGALTQPISIGAPFNMLRWKQSASPMATIAEGYGMAIESRGVTLRGQVHPRFPNSLQIKYGEGLSGIAKAHRSANSISKSKNIAVLEYVENGVRKTKLFESKRSNGVSLHSEDLAAIWIKENKIDPNSVTRLYSEFHPCVTCDPNVRKFLPNAEVQFSWPYTNGLDEISRLGREAKLSEIGGL